MTYRATRNNSIIINYLLPVLLLLIPVMTVGQTAERSETGNLDQVATDYVKLLLFAEQYDDDIVDAYYGPDSLRPNELDFHPEEHPPFDSLKQVVESFQKKLGDSTDWKDLSNVEQKRARYLKAQLRALRTRLRILGGERLPYDEESKLIYDVVVPEFTAAHFDSIVATIDTLVPGNGDLFDRWRQYEDRFRIPEDKVKAVMQAAIDEVRRRTKEHITLPEGERFDLELVNNVSWGAYNWYQGNYHSLIQINTDQPTYLTGVVGLAGHEGYPGHHVSGVLQDSVLYRGRGWIEFSIIPLFSPTSVLSEGMGNYAAKLVMPTEDRIKFESEVLCPLSGLDSTGLGLFHKVSKLFKELSWAAQVAARNYVDRKWSREETVAWLKRYTSSSQGRVLRSLDFYDQYRAYLVNYAVGEKMVADYMNRHAPNDPDRQWELFTQLYTTPSLPTDLLE